MMKELACVPICQGRRGLEPPTAVRFIEKKREKDGVRGQKRERKKMVGEGLEEAKGNEPPQNQPS
jgi:hypothetical protein